MMRYSLEVCKKKVCLHHHMVLFRELLKGNDAHATAGEEGAAVPARRYPMRMRKPPSEWWDVSRQRESSNRGREELPEEVGGMAMLVALHKGEPASFANALKSVLGIMW
jgi:hypothetical protein